MTLDASVAERPSWLDTLLRPFSRVRPGEGWQAALLLVCIFLILTSYYLMKTAREGMILAGTTLGLRGAELKSYAGGAMAILLVGVVPAYSALASRVPRLRLINISYAAVIGCLVLFYAAAVTGVSIGLVFFIWIGIVNMFLIAQFWSYANDLYSEEQGKRLFALIAIGGSVGAILGPRLAATVSTYSLLPLAGVLLAASLGVFNIVERLHHKNSEHVARRPIEGPGGFSLVLGDKYLLAIAALVLVAEVVKTNGEFVLSRTATAYAAAHVPPTAHPELVGAARAAAIAADRRQAITAYYGNFFFWVNSVGFLLQAFCVSRLIEKAGVRRSLIVMPLIALGAYGAIAAFGGFAIVRAAKITENSTEYSVQSTVRQTLFLPTGRDAKYKAKAAIDTFVVRAGDAISALVVWAGLHGLHAGRRGFAIVNLVLVGAWLVIARIIARHHRAISREPEPEPEPEAAVGEAEVACA